MAFHMLRVLVKTPELNPISKKAHSVPVLNPADKYGRVFFFSWLGFLIAFLSWYAFPPLVRPIASIFERKTSSTETLAPIVDNHNPRGPEHDTRRRGQF